jgi:hypothetical protein
LKIEISKSFKKRYARRIEGFDFEVGVLKAETHYEPAPDIAFGKPALKNFAGGPARKQGRTKSDLTTGEILVENMKRLNINLLLKPFRKKGSDLLRFTNEFLKMATSNKKTSLKRVENLLQAVVRNPILKKQYGQNRSKTADAKGFNRNIIDTSQTFKAIRAKAYRRV